MWTCWLFSLPFFCPNSSRRVITRIQDAMVLVAAISSNRRKQNSFVFLCLSLPSSPLGIHTYPPSPQVCLHYAYATLRRSRSLSLSPERALAYDEIRSGNLCKHEFCFKIQRARLTELWEKEKSAHCNDDLCKSPSRTYSWWWCRRRDEQINWSIFTECFVAFDVTSICFYSHAAAVQSSEFLCALETKKKRSDYVDVQLKLGDVRRKEESKHVSEREASGMHWANERKNTFPFSLSPSCQPRSRRNKKSRNHISQRYHPLDKGMNLEGSFVLKQEKENPGIAMMASVFDRSSNRMKKSLYLSSHFLDTYGYRRLSRISLSLWWST